MADQAPAQAVAQELDETTLQVISVAIAAYLSNRDFGPSAEELQLQAVIAAAVEAYVESVLKAPPTEEQRIAAVIAAAVAAVLGPHAVVRRVVPVDKARVSRWTRAGRSSLMGSSSSSSRMVGVDS